MSIFLSRKKLLSLIYVLAVFAIVSPLYSVKAQTSGSPFSVDSLTKANGWDCNATKSSCTNSDSSSQYFKSTVSCSSAGSGASGQSSSLECFLKNADGSSANASITANAGAISADATQRDANGAVTGAQSQTKPSGSLTDCSVWSPLSYGNCALKGIGSIILEFANVLLGFAGILFNYAVVKTVFQFATIIGNSPGLLVAWGILRDIGNMLLLFGFIFMGVGTILDLHSYNAKKSLPFLIIFAVLMNFSLFAAEAVIDTSNVFASIMYSQANTDNCNTNILDAKGKFAATDCVNNGIAGHILESTGLASVWSGKDVDLNVTTYLFLALFATIAAVVLIAGAIMLIIRAVTLSFLMVTAPIGFAGMAIPVLHDAASKWWHQLINQSFFAPIFLLCIFISLKITDGLASGHVSFAAAIESGDSNLLAILLMFSIVIGFLVASIVVAKKMGAMGAGFAVKTAGGAVYGTMAFAGRRSLGYASNSIAGRISKSDWARKNPNASRYAYQIANKGATSSFDFRSSKLAGSLTEHTGDLGKPGKDASHGFHGEEEAAVKRRTDFAAKLKMTEDEKKAVQYAETDIKKNEEEIKNLKKDQAAVITSGTATESGVRRDNESLLAPLRGALDRKKALVEAARSAGDDAAVSALELQYNNDLRSYEVQETQAKKRLEDAQSDTKKQKEEFDVKIKAKEEAVARRKQEMQVNQKAPQIEYAKAIEHKGVNVWPFIGGHVNHEAAAQIIKNVNKTENQKLIDALSGVQKTVASATGGGGGHPPTAGGGSPAHPPSSGGGGGGHGTSH